MKDPNQKQVDQAEKVLEMMRNYIEEENKVKYDLGVLKDVDLEILNYYAIPMQKVRLNNAYEGLKQNYEDNKENASWKANFFSREFLKMRHYVNIDKVDEVIKEATILKILLQDRKEKRSKE